MQQQMQIFLLGVELVSPHLTPGVALVCPGGQNASLYTSNAEQARPLCNARLIGSNILLMYAHLQAAWFGRILNTHYNASIVNFSIH